jgi:Mrp family chromosome partitioning ATPase
LKSRPKYRLLVQQLLATNGNENGNANGHSRAKTVGVMACESARFRSRVAADLAIQAAGSTSVLLIDADDRNRRLANKFQLNGSAGLRELIGGRTELGDCIHTTECENLAIMSPGSPHGDEHAAEPAGQPSGFDAIKGAYELVVVDLPQGSSFEGRAAACGWLDEVVLVVEAERTRVASAREAKDSLERAGLHVAGVVLANRRDYVPRWLSERL